MTKTELEHLGDGIATIAIRAAQEYLQVHDLTANTQALSECLSSWIKIKFPEAAKDAKGAFDCGMIEAGKQSFALSIAQAGIEAAKECAMPIAAVSENLNQTLI